MVRSCQFITPTVLDNATPTTYTVPAGMIATILQLGFSSDNAAVRTVTVTINGKNMGTAIPIVPTGQIPEQWRNWLGGVLIAGDVVSFLASAAADVTVWMSGRLEVA